STATSLAGPSAGLGVTFRSTVAAKFAEPCGVSTPAWWAITAPLEASRTWKSTPLTPPGARAVAVVCTLSPSVALAAGEVRVTDGWVTSLQVMVVGSQTWLEVQGGLQVEVTHAPLTQVKPV